MLGAVRVDQDTLDSVIKKMSEKYFVDAPLIKAFIRQESNWDVNASRYEAHLNDSSWGLMQVLLKTARSVLEKPTLTIADLITPEVNIEAGVKFISQLLNRYSYKLNDAIAAYNAGSPRRNKDGSYVNQSYVDGINRWYEMYKAMESVSNATSNVVDTITKTFSSSQDEASSSQTVEQDQGIMPILVGGSAVLALVLFWGSSK